MNPTRSLTGLFLMCALVISISAQPPKARGVDSVILAPLPAREDRRMCAMIEIRNVTGQCTSRSRSGFGEARRAQFSYIPGHTSRTATGRDRRSAREISNIVFNQEPSENIPNGRRLNQMFVFFGQFLDHNFALTPENSSDEMDIEVPTNDPNLNKRKLRFRRSRRGPTTMEANGGERPINTLTSAVDLDAVYGPSQRRADELSEMRNGERTGKMRVSPGNLLPLNTRGFVNSPDTSRRFFIAGDTRSNEHSALTAVHTIFLREHNRLCDMIKERVPSLSGEDIYQVARAMNIAQFQKIVFEQFYPAIIGRNLRPYAGHRRNAVPTVSDIFTGAAFRIGHTMVGTVIPRRGPSGPLSPVPVARTFFRPASEFTNPEMDNIIRGISNTLAQEVDVKIVNTLRNQLFQFVPQEDELFDLIALNLQRGRDHALPTFNEIRRIFRLPVATSFSDITRNAEIASKLSEAYRGDIDEVEAFPGLLAEDHAPGSGVGPTMRAVWEREFLRVRDGDQYYFLNRGAFPDALEENFGDFVSQIRTPQPNLLRDIITRNSGVTASQLPSGNIFTA